MGQCQCASTKSVSVAECYRDRAAPQNTPANPTLLTSPQHVDSKAIWGETKFADTGAHDKNSQWVHLIDTPSASFEDAQAFKLNLFSKTWLHASSIEMIAMLKYFGATVEDLRRVINPHTSPHSELWFNEPKLPWKKTQASRFVLRKPHANSSFEGCDSKSEVKFEVDKSQVDFGEFWESSDSSVRSWETLPAWYDSENNTVYMAYQRLSHYLIDPAMEPAPGCMSGSDIYFSDHFCIRITKKPEDDEMAQPSPEGVHQDGSDIIMITFMDRVNVDENTGRSRIWDIAQPSGPYPEKSFGSIKDRCLADFVMSQPFETLFAIDSKVKHEARAIKPLNKQLACSRDVIVHWTRTSRTSGCDEIGPDCDANSWKNVGLKSWSMEV